MKEVADDARSKEEMLKHLVSVLLYTYMYIQGYFYHVFFSPFLETPGILKTYHFRTVNLTTSCIWKMTWCKQKAGPSHFSIPVRRNNTDWINFYTVVNESFSLYRTLSITAWRRMRKDLGIPRGWWRSCPVSRNRGLE